MWGQPCPSTPARPRSCSCGDSRVPQPRPGRVAAHVGTAASAVRRSAAPQTRGVGKHSCPPPLPLILPGVSGRIVFSLNHYNRGCTSFAFFAKGGPSLQSREYTRTTRPLFLRRESRFAQQPVRLCDICPCARLCFVRSLSQRKARASRQQVGISHLLSIF